MRQEPDNDTRADWAEQAVNEFGRLTYGGRSFTHVIKNQTDENGDAHTMISDLICDCLHLANRHGWDHDKIISNALSNFNAEVCEALENPPGG